MLDPTQVVASFDSASVLHAATVAALTVSLSAPRQLGPGGPMRKGGRSAAMVGLPVSIPESAPRRNQSGRLGDVNLSRRRGFVRGSLSERRYPPILLGSSNGALTHLPRRCRCPGCPTPCWCRSRGSAILTARTMRWSSVVPSRQRCWTAIPTSCCTTCTISCRTS